MKIWRNIYDKDHVLRCKMYLEDYLVPYSYEEISPYLEVLDPSIYISVETLNQNPFVMIGQKESGHILGISNLVIVMIIWFFMIPKILKSLK